MTSVRNKLLTASKRKLSIVRAGIASRVKCDVVHIVWEDVWHSAIIEVCRVAERLSIKMGSLSSSFETEETYQY